MRSIMKGTLSKILGLLLVFMTVFGAIPIEAFAQETGSSSPAPASRYFHFDGEHLVANDPRITITPIVGNIFGSENNDAESIAPLVSSIDGIIPLNRAYKDCNT